MQHNHPDPATSEALATYTPVQLTQRHDGWTADRQRTFLYTLAETGRVTEAAKAAGVSVRSAYRLRTHPDGGAFAGAWDDALYCASHRLMAIALERATVGGYREVWKDGKLHSATRAPSDPLLMFLLRHMAPKMFSIALPKYRQDPVTPAERGFDGALTMLGNIDSPIEDSGDQTSNHL